MLGVPVKRKKIIKSAITAEKGPQEEESKAVEMVQDSIDNADDDDDDDVLESSDDHYWMDRRKLQ